MGYKSLINCGVMENNKNIQTRKCDSLEKFQLRT